MNDLVSLVLCRLEPRELARASCVCKEWKRVAAPKGDAWRAAWRRAMPPAVQRFENVTKEGVGFRAGAVWESCAQTANFMNYR
jgi:hypothetical protein